MINIFEEQSLLEILFGDHPDFDLVKEIFITEHKFSNTFRHIVRHIPTGKFYAINATHNYHDGIEPYEENPVEVFPKEKVITVYE